MHKIVAFLAAWLSRSGDTTFWSWVITALYAVTMVLALYYVKKNHAAKTQRFLWKWITAFLFVMGINKQLDLQILVTMAGSFVANHLGFIDYRREIQKALAVTIFVGLSFSGVVILLRARAVLRQCLIELIGVATLAFFALVRVGSISHLHKATAFEYHKGVRIHGLELLGLVVILIALIAHIKNIPPAQQRSSCR